MLDVTRLECFRPIGHKQNQNQNKHDGRLSLGEFRKVVSWSKFLVSSGGKIKGREEDEEAEWSADMSQLFFGRKFASGRHSQIYRGFYKKIEVAIKMTIQPEEDPNLASALETHFTSEVSLLLHLRHPNIITVRSILPFFY